MKYLKVDTLRQIGKVKPTLKFEQQFLNTNMTTI